MSVQLERNSILARFPPDTPLKYSGKEPKLFPSTNAVIAYLSLTRILSPYFKSITTTITEIPDNERL